MRAGHLLTLCYDWSSFAFGNPDPKIGFDHYDFKDNEVLLFVPSYDTGTGLYQGLKKN